MINKTGLIWAVQYLDLDADKFFGIYCADNILLNYDLSSEEIESGIDERYPVIVPGWEHLTPFFDYPPEIC